MRRQVLALLIAAATALTGTGLAACGFRDASIPKTVVTSAPPIAPVQEQPSNVAPNNPICAAQDAQNVHDVCNDLMAAIAEAQTWMNTGGQNAAALKEWWTSLSVLHLEEELASHRSKNDTTFVLSIIMQPLVKVQFREEQDAGRPRVEIRTLERWQIAREIINGVPIVEEQPALRRLTYVLRFDSGVNHYQVIQMYNTSQ